ncbi:MAG: hypothetical protein CR972_02245 [Candidatus Moraniibacteriota bacterium]|nr:MAG: hypothetical protein CR972_02245 [Candidatus Moranbacteria bacterium]
MRKTIFTPGEFYHIYNRGVEKREIFLSDADYHRFLLSCHLLNDTTNGMMQKYRDIYRAQNPKVRPSDIRRSDLGMPVAREKLIEMVAYCLNPNHYHMIVREKESGGIKKFMQKIGTSYTMYFNKKYKRTGVLFQGKFKSIHIDSDAYLLYLSAYVNDNHFIHGYDDSEWQYASYMDYIGKRNGRLCNTAYILGHFKNQKEYDTFVKKNALYLKEKKEREKYILE